MTRIIPNSISDIFTYINNIEGYVAKDPNPISISALSENPFFTKDEIKYNMKYLWEVIEIDDLFLWIIQSNKWNKKTWRNNFIKKLQNNLKTSILIFIDDSFSKDSIIDIFSMTIINMDGIIDFETVIPEKPDEHIAKVWESLKTDSLTDVLEFESKISCEKYRLDAKNILDALESRSTDNLIESFSKAGHILTKSHYILPKLDTVLKNAILVISQEAIDPKKIMKDYLAIPENDTKSELNWIIRLGFDSISYFYKSSKLIDIEFPHLKSEKKKGGDDKEISLKILTSIISQISGRALFNSESFAYQYGEFSILYYFSLNKLKTNFIISRENKLKIIFAEWKKRFEEVYRQGDTTDELFLKHSYLALLIRLVLFVTYFPENELKNKSIIEMTNWLEEKGFSLFTYDFFAWSLDEIELIETLFYGIRPFYYVSKSETKKIYRLFEADDLFRTIYQQMVSPSTRHALGEFYTPPELARLMVNESYHFNNYVLDPACGSGTFLVEIIRKIRSEKLKSQKEQFEALEKVFGFDVNPIAVATSKANILLQLKDLLEEKNTIPINIFLCNTLFPLQMTEDKTPRLDYGEVYVYTLSAINDSVEISKNFFTDINQQKLGTALSQLDTLMTQERLTLKEFDIKLNKMLADTSYQWMEEEIGVQKKKLKDNFKAIAKKFFNLSLEEKNHIWTYLLYNTLGTVIIANKIDLVIGNPPWLVLKDINNAIYKEQVKELASTLGINPEPKQAPNLEMSALFLYVIKKFLKDQGKVFFVVSNAFATGDNHARTRQFKQFRDISIYKFSKDVFNIHNICISAILDYSKNYSLGDMKKLLVNTVFFDPVYIHNRIEFNKNHEEIYVPFEVVEDKNHIISVKKLIPKSEIDSLLPFGDNYYGPLCFRGGDLFPRNLLFVKIEKNEGDFVEISHIINLPKKPWDFDPIAKLGLKEKTVKVEKKYIYQTIKSEYVIPFLAINTEPVFIPLDDDGNVNNDYKITIDKKSFGWKYYQQLNQLFKQEQKEGATLTDLWENNNYLNKLCAKRQKKPFRVVMPMTGSLVKACLIRDTRIIIDTSNYFIGLDSELEAYYVIGYLNSPAITRSIQLIQDEGAGGSGRNIHKRPFSFILPKFNPKDELHKKISNKAKEMEKKVQDITQNWINNEKQSILKKSKGKITSIVDIISEDILKPMTIQNQIYRDLGFDTKSFSLTGDYEELDTFIHQLFYGAEIGKKKTTSQKGGLKKYLGVPKNGQK